MTDEPRRVRELLTDAGDRLGVARPLQAGMLWRGWAGIVGETIAAHAEPSSLRDGVLRVRTDSPAWATEIGYLGAEIRAKVNLALGEEVVTEVRVWTGLGAIDATGAADGGGRRSLVPTGPRSLPNSPLEAFERARAAWARRGGRRR